MQFCIVNNRASRNYLCDFAMAGIRIRCGAYCTLMHFISLAQELHGTDFNLRVQFCQWAETPDVTDLLPVILFSDEITFTNRDEVNRHGPLLSSMGNVIVSHPAGTGSNLDLVSFLVEVFSGGFHQP